LHLRSAINQAGCRTPTNGDLLSAGDSAAANAALSGDAGRALVDAMDATLLDVVGGRTGNVRRRAGRRLALAPPSGSVVTSHNMQIYLRANVLFRPHQRNFVQTRESADAVVPLLPSI
jgi:hypothetical protein